MGRDLPRLQTVLFCPEAASPPAGSALLRGEVASPLERGNSAGFCSYFSLDILKQNGVWFRAGCVLLCVIHPDLCRRARHRTLQHSGIIQ